MPLHSVSCSLFLGQVLLSVWFAAAESVLLLARMQTTQTWHTKCFQPVLVVRVPRCPTHNPTQPWQAQNLNVPHVQAQTAAAAHPRQHCRLLTRLGVKAASKAAAPTSFITDNPIGQQLARLVGTPLFVAMEVSVLLAMLALTDAAYSGDWSRIGVISADTEPLLQKITIFVWALHGVCGLVAANVASSKGRSPGSAAFKAFLFGTLHVFEELVLEPVMDGGAAGATGRAAGQRGRAGRR